MNFKNELKVASFKAQVPSLHQYPHFNQGLVSICEIKLRLENYLMKPELE